MPDNNNFGLSFNPQYGLGLPQQSVPTTVNDYFNPNPPKFDIFEWWNNRSQKDDTPAISTNIPLGFEKINPMFYLDKWDKGYTGLDEDERSLWEQQNAEKIANKDSAWIDRLWRNQQFVKAFGMDTFLGIPNKEDRDRLYQDTLTEEIFQDVYGQNKNIMQLNSLTPEGKRELLNSGYKTDWQLNQQDKQASNKGWGDYSLKERWNAINTDMGTYGEAGMFGGGVIGGVAGGGVGALPGMVIGGTAGVLAGLLAGIFHPEDATQVNASERRTDNEDILNKITVADNNRKKEQSLSESNQLYSNYIQAYQNGQISKDDVDQMFDQIALNGKRTAIDQLGNSEQYDYVGSNYYSAFKGTDEFEHFGTFDKLKYIAQTQVLANKYGRNSALNILDQDMQNYINENQSGWTWAGNSLKNVWVGGVANLMNNATALGALGAYLGYGEKGLANFLNGKDASGNGSDNWFNPQYWNKVDQYNTFGLDDWYNPFSYNPENMRKVDENGGISPYNNVLTPGTENDFWSWNTMNEAVRMNKFTWSQLLQNMALGKLVKGATRLAGGIEMAPGVLASESTTASKVINQLGSWGIVGSSSLGIDAAYGLQTYNDVLEQNNRRLDGIIEKEVAEEVEERLKSPKALKEFREGVAAENERRKRRAGEKGNYIVVDEDLAWQDFTALMTARVQKEKELAHADDRQEALNDAANAYAIDATIEAIRMSTTNGVFKSYLFDRGTLNAIRANNPYVDTTFKNGAYALGKNAVRKKAMQTFGMNVWGGFQSNYFDDITVGYAKGFGIQDYNNYLIQKYNPAAYGSVLDDYVNPYLAGMLGAANASEEKRSFLDGTIGALGSVFSVSPNISGAINHKERMKQIAEAIERGDKNAKLSGWEIASDFVNNPILEAFAQAKESARMTQNAIDRANKTIKEHGYSFDNMVETVSALNGKVISREGTSVLQAEDAKDKEAFALASTLLSLKNNGAVQNAQAEPDKANWSKKKKAANTIARGFNTLIGMPLFEEASSPYTRAMQILRDASTLNEEASNAEQANRQQQLIDTFLGLDANKEVLSSMSDEERQQFARERLQKNASKLLNIMQRTEEVQKKLENSIQAQISPDIKQQLMYQYVLDEQWKGRKEELEQKIQGPDVIVTDSRNREDVVIAKYGSMEGLERAKKAQEKKVTQAQKEYEDAKLNAKKENDPTKSIAENARLKAVRIFSERAAKDALKKEQAAFDKILIERGILEEALDGGKEAPVVKAKDILRLSADERLRMLDDFYREDYSQEQQQEIDLAKNMMMADGTSLNEAMMNVRDAAILEHRIADNMQTAKKIMSNPFEANAMQRALIENRRRAIIDFFNDKIVAKAQMELMSNPENLIDDAHVADAARKYSTAVLNGIQKNIDKTGSELSDKDKSIIIDGINQIIDERRNQMKETTELDKFLRKTKKVNHTEVISNSVPTIDITSGKPTSVAIEERTSQERELSQNDKKLMEYALDYAAERAVPMDELGEKVATKEFEDYVQERNHGYQMGANPLSGEVREINVGTAENRANPVSREYMKGLVDDVVDAFKVNKEQVDAQKEEKPTAAKPESVATKPVETKGDPKADDVRPDDVKATAFDDPFGTKKQAASTQESSQKGTQEKKADEKTSNSNSERNNQIMDHADVLNSKLLEDLDTLLKEVDKMAMPDATREKIKDLIDAQVQARVFDNIQALQNAVMEDAVISNQAEAPQLAAKATALMNINISDKKTNANTGSSQANQEKSSNNSTRLTALPMHLESMDLDFLIDNDNYTSLSNYIKAHNIVSFLQRLSDFWRNDYNKAHKGQVVFIYDPALAKQVEEGIANKGGKYIESQAAPLIMALEITDQNKHLVEDETQLVEIKDFSDNKTIRKYQPIGIMPASTNSKVPSAGRTEALRNTINPDIEGPQVLRYTTKKGKGKGGPIQTGIESIESHTEEESIPRSGEGIPKKNVQQLMDENNQSPTEMLVKASEEEKRVYQEAKDKGDRKAIRATNLYKKLRDAFIKRLVKRTKASSNPDDADSKLLKFKVQKGSHDTFEKTVLTKAIGQSSDRNTGRPIVDLLKEVNDSGDNAREVIESNSRFKKLWNAFQKLGLSGLFDDAGNPINRVGYEQELSKYASSVKNAIEDALIVDGLNVTVDISEGTPSEKTINIRVYSGNQEESNLLSTLTTKYNGKISEAEYASFLKDLILDSTGNTRQGIKDSRFERVKWRVNYEDANTIHDEDKPSNIRDVAMNNLKDVYDDGILEIQLTKVAYPARSVTALIGPKMKSELYSDAPVQPEQRASEDTDNKAANEVIAADGRKVDGDTGLEETAPSRESIISKIPKVIKDTITKILNDSQSRDLAEGDSKHYSIGGELWSRVTSIKYALEGMGKRFDPNSGWALPSSKIGDSFDEFGRDVFNHIFDEMSDAERLSEFENYDNSTAKNYSDGYAALKAFEARLALKDQVVLAIGNRENPGKIVTKGVLDVTVKGENGVETKKVRVAGTLDVLAIDDKGQLHIYDFKTHRSTFGKTQAIEKGYDRQLSMYAKFLEEEYGLKVASINIIPIKAEYPNPSGQEQATPQKDFRQARQGSNQLQIKDINADNNKYEDFRGANFKVEEEFELNRLSDDKLIASFDKMTEEEKATIVEAIQDQSSHPGDEITSTEDIVSSKPEITETKKSEESNISDVSFDNVEEGFNLFDEEESEDSSKADTSTVGTVDALIHAQGEQTREEEHKKNCGTGK